MRHCILLLAAALLFLLQVNAQIGPSITTPAYNSTVNPNEKITIEYTYQNVGTGTYMIDVSLWRDASATQLIQNVTTDYVIPGGNSTGYQLAFNYTATYDWKVPKSLQFTETFDNGTSIQVSPKRIYLTLTLDTETTYRDTHLRSRPILLHYNAGAMALPNLVLLVALVTIGLVLVTGP